MPETTDHPGEPAPGLPGPGEEWAYRLKEFDPSERVLVHAVTHDKRKSRADIEFVDGAKSGTRTSVPGGRLKVPWREATAYDLTMANWRRLGSERLDEVEDYAVTIVFGCLIPEDVADPDGGRVPNTTTVFKPDELENLIGLPPAQLAEMFPSFEHNGNLVLSPEGTLAIAENACRRNPHPILAEIMEEEARTREHCKRGRDCISPLDGTESFSSPEREYDFYVRYDKPRHELLRQWCGYRAVSVHERLAAAEAECRRLDEVLARTIDTLKNGDAAGMAEALEREHEEGRITPYNVRPVPDRPLAPWEVPVREVPARRRWGW